MPGDNVVVIPNLIASQANLMKAQKVCFRFAYAPHNKITAQTNQRVNVKLGALYTFLFFGYTPVQVST
jgi:hypothetical protein